MLALLRIGLLGCFLTVQTGAGIAAEHEVPFEILATSEQAKELPEELLAAADSRKLENTQAVVTALVIIAGAVAFRIVADAVADFVWNLTSNGVIVDVRNGRMEIKESPALSARQMILVSDKGTEIVEVSKREEIGPMLESLAAGLK